MPVWDRVAKALPRSTAPLRMTGSQPGAQLRSPSAVNSGKTRTRGASRRKLRTWVAGGVDMAELHLSWYICTILTIYDYIANVRCFPPYRLVTDSGTRHARENRQAASRNRAHPDRRAAGEAAAEGAQGPGRVPGPFARRPAGRHRAARAGEQAAVQDRDAGQDREPEA